MKKAMLFLFLLTLPAFGQTKPVSVIDFVKIKNGKSAEAMFFYENNWKVYRDIALKKGVIRSYQLLQTKADAAADFDLILITEYADAEQLKLSEERFNAIIKETNPKGAKLLNSIPPEEFRKVVFSKTAETTFSVSPNN